MRRKLITLIASLAIPGLASAAELEGVTVPDSIEAGGQELVLNGLGLRKKFWVEVYVAALYLPARTGNAVEALDAEGPKRLEMHMLYDVSRDKLVDAWDEGFESNSDPDTLTAIAGQIAQFNLLWSDSQEGDVFVLEYLPGSGTRVVMNGEDAGTIEGDDFARALFAIWLGPEPPTDDLKEGLLGG